MTWRCLAELADDTATVAEILGRDRRALRRWRLLGAAGFGAGRYHR